MDAHAGNGGVVSTSTVQHTLSTYKVQEQFIYDPRLFVAFVGGRGAGKTIAGAMRAIAQGYLQRPGLGMVVAPTYQMMKDAPWRAALEIWPSHGAKINKSDARITLGNGHEIIFRSADDPNRLRGPSASWAWIDEAAMCDPQTWPILLGVLRQGGKMGSCWITTTPKGFNWVYDVFVTQENEDTSLYRAPTSANPFTDDRFKESMKRMYAAGFAQQELDAEFVTLGAGLIKRFWFRAVLRPQGLKWVRYWDLAASTKTSADYTASVRAAERDGVVYLADLIRGRWEWPDTKRIIEQTIEAEPDTTVVGIEKTAFQLAAFQEIARSRLALKTVIKGIAPDKDKLSRALPWIAKAEQGNVALVAGTPWEAFLSETDQFPEGDHDDAIDAVSGAVAMVGNNYDYSAAYGAVECTCGRWYMNPNGDRACPFCGSRQ